jgi:hypothetical protein
MLVWKEERGGEGKRGEGRGERGERRERAYTGVICANINVFNHMTLLGKIVDHIHI